MERRWAPEGPTPRGGAIEGGAAPPLGVGALWLLFVSSSVFWILPRKIGVLAFVSSNSENISLTAFLKTKSAENRELALWHLVNRLVPENA